VAPQIVVARGLRIQGVGESLFHEDGRVGITAIWEPEALDVGGSLAHEGRCPAPPIAVARGIEAQKV